MGIAAAAVEQLRPARVVRASSRLMALAVVVGGVVGVLTSFGQGWLGETLNPLVNSVSVWVVAPFALGVLARRRGGVGPAAVAGLLTCVAQVAGYYATAHARGFASTQEELVFWSVAGLIGGPVFAAAAALGGAGRTRGLAAATLSASFLAEGLWQYGHVQDRWGSATLWCAIGVVVLGVEGRRAVPRATAWLIAVLPLAVAAFVAVGRFHG